MTDQVSENSGDTDGRDSFYPETQSILSGYMTVLQLAAELGNSPRTLDRWHRLKIGPPRVVIGRLVLYRIESVRTWLRSREQQFSNQTRRRKTRT